MRTAGDGEKTDPTAKGKRDLAKPSELGEIEKVLMKGDLSNLTEPQRVQHYYAVCESLGINPLTQPFGYIMLNGKLALYAKKDCAEQLRKIQSISTSVVGRETQGDIYIVTVRTSDKSGRTDEATGVVPIAELKGEVLANAYMKAETKAKRRATLSHCGLGFLDESEVGSTNGTIIEDQSALPASAAPSEPLGAKGKAEADAAAGLASAVASAQPSAGSAKEPPPAGPEAPASTDGEVYPDCPWCGTSEHLSKLPSYSDPTYYCTVCKGKFKQDGTVIEAGVPPSTQPVLEGAKLVEAAKEVIEPEPKGAADPRVKALHAYWALHSELGLPKHSGEGKATNHEIWAQVIQRTYESWGAAAPEVWQALTFFLMRVKYTRLLQNGNISEMPLDPSGGDDPKTGQPRRIKKCLIPNGWVMALAATPIVALEPGSAFDAE